MAFNDRVTPLGQCGQQCHMLYDSVHQLADMPACLTAINVPSPPPLPPTQPLLHIWLAVCHMPGGGALKKVPETMTRKSKWPWTPPPPQGAPTPSLKPCSWGPTLLVMVVYVYVLVVHFQNQPGTCVWHM